MLNEVSKNILMQQNNNNIKHYISHKIEHHPEEVAYNLRKLQLPQQTQYHRQSQIVRSVSPHRNRHEGIILH